MMLVRDVFQAEYGKGDDLVSLFKEARQKWPQGYADRILTDVSGRFFTVVVEKGREPGRVGAAHCRSLCRARVR